MPHISTFDQNDADFFTKKTVKLFFKTTTCGLQVVFLIVGVKIT